MTKLFEGNVVNTTTLRAILEEKMSGVNFDNKKELVSYISEIVCDLVERPIYDESDFTHDDGHTIDDLIANASAMIDMQRELISEICKIQNLV